MNVDKNNERRTQAQRRATTRRALLVAARSVFAERGYHGAAAEEIVRRAGLTRGALYHRFEDKKDLFRAVVDEMEGQVPASSTDSTRRHAKQGRPVRSEGPLFVRVGPLSPSEERARSLEV